jgi:aminocarboxymuconate-semialdehyde decarboxylase
MTFVSPNAAQPLGLSRRPRIGVATAGAVIIRIRPADIATLPSGLQRDAAAAARVAEFAVNELGAAGVVVAANVEGVNLGELALDELWHAAVELKAPVFIHPVQAMPTPRIAKFALTQNRAVHLRYHALRWLVHLRGRDRFPELRIILSHGGGTFPWLLGRFDCLHATMDRAAQADVAQAPHAVATNARLC